MASCGVVVVPLSAGAKGVVWRGCGITLCGSERRRVAWLWYHSLQERKASCGVVVRTLVEMAVPKARVRQPVPVGAETLGF